MKIIIKPLGLVVLGAALVAGIAIPQLKKPKGVSGIGGASSGVGENLTPAQGWQAYHSEGGYQVSEALRQLPPGVSGAGVHIEAQKITKDPWSVGYTQALKSAFADKERVTLTFWARAKAPQNLRIAMQFPSHSYHECWSKEQTLTPHWKAYRFSFSTEKFNPGEGNLAFQSGYALGWVELADIRLTRG